MGADLRLAVAAALSRANRSLKALEELKSLPAPAPALDVSFQMIEGRLIVTINGEKQDLGRVAGDDGESVSLVDVRKLVTTWLAENISQPKDGESPSIEQIAEVATRWLEANVERLRGQPGRPADQVDLPALLGELKGMSTAWLAKNIKQPRDGRDPTFAEIKTVVDLWMQFNARDHLQGIEQLKALATQWLASNIRQPKDGESVTFDQVERVVSSWMRLNHKPPKDPEPGKTIIVPGVGIDHVEQPNAETARFVLTSGKHFDIKLPKGKAGEHEKVYIGGPSGISALQVQQMIEEAMTDMGPIEVSNDTGDQLRADSGEIEYTPGLTPFSLDLADGAGDHTVYTAPAGKAFRIRRSKAMPIPRGTEESPRITVKLLDSSGALVRTLFIDGFISVRQLITGPVGGKIAVSLDIAARVTGGFNIEEFTP